VVVAVIHHSGSIVVNSGSPTAKFDRVALRSNSCTPVLICVVTCPRQGVHGDQLHGIRYYKGTLLSSLGTILNVAVSVVSKNGEPGGFSIARRTKDAPTNAASLPSMTQANGRGNKPFTTRPTIQHVVSSSK
jgi:hypothetical protein